LAARDQIVCGKPPFLGGQATVLALIPYGRAKGSADATLTGNLGLGGPGFTISGGRTDETLGFGDVAGMFNVRWNAGVHNTIAYVATNFTTGRYDPTRLANLGLGHNVIDAGGGYTYFDTKTGIEFSAVLGFDPDGRLEKRKSIRDLAMSQKCRLCCKTILSMWARNIDSRSRTAKQLRFKSALVPIRLFQNPIPQLLYGDFCNTICHKRTIGVNSPAAPPGISKCRLGFQRAGDRAEPCNSSPAWSAGS
jgi:hypothetical protein